MISKHSLKQFKLKLVRKISGCLLGKLASFPLKNPDGIWGSVLAPCLKNIYQIHIKKTVKH
jgi:hypothetical protein